MMRLSWAAALAAMLSASALAADGHAPKIERGTEGLTEFVFEARNLGNDPIACGAAIAHWYSLDLGRADSGQTVRQVLWFDATRGAVFIMNADDVRLPVESLWCGLAGRAWETRHAVTLPTRAGATAADIAIGCETAEARLLCR